MELNDISGVGPSRADDLEELGYDSVEAVAEADPDSLTELSRVGEDKALEMVVDAQNLLDESSDGDEEPEDSITFDEDELEEDEPEVEEVEAEDAEPEEPEQSRGPYEISFDLTDRQREILITALLDSHTDLRSNHHARSNACDDTLVKFRDGDTVSLTEDELNALHAAIRQRRLDYQGNNHIDLMQATMPIENQIADARQEHLF